MARLKWKESNGVYQPNQKNLREFIRERQEQIVEYSDVESLYVQIRNEPMIVFVAQKAEFELIRHLSIDRYTETGGVVVGEAYFCPETQEHYTEIVGSIAATHTVGNAVHFQFTPECWSSIFKNQKQHYPGTTIVGWYHSHPNHGIFLSGTDLNTQRLSFNKIWQIAVVFDPQRKEIGYFYSADGIRIEPIYLSNLSISQQVRWGKNLPTTQFREERTEARRGGEITLPPLPPSQAIQNRFVANQRNLSKPRSQIKNQIQNPVIIIFALVLLAVLLVALISLALYLVKSIDRKIFQSYPQNITPPQQQIEPRSSEPDLELKAPELRQLESSESESLEESESSETKSQFNQSEP